MRSLTSYCRDKENWESENAFELKVVYEMLYERNQVIKKLSPRLKLQIRFELHIMRLQKR